MALILKAMANYVGLTNKDMTSKWICFGCDGNVVFKGHHNGVITQVKEQIALYVLGVHFTAHQTNLIVLVSSKMNLVANIESMLQSLYAFFSQYPKKFLKFFNLVKTLETKGLKLMHNIKTHWISMLSPIE
jgi:hypothetical protein